MCGNADSNSSAAAAASANKPVSPAALAAAIIMIVVGIIIVMAYGHQRKRAWRPEQTFVLQDEDQAIPVADVINDSDAPTLPKAKQAHGDAGFDDVPLAPLQSHGTSSDNGLSDTLQTSLLPEDN